MTVNEILKALELCPLNNSRCSDCMECPYETKPFCTDDLQEDLIDLITSQRAEIEWLKKNNEYILMQHAFQRRPDGDCWNDVIEKAKAEAVKEFAEKIKCIDYDALIEEWVGHGDIYYGFNYVEFEKQIDNLVQGNGGL